MARLFGAREHAASVACTRDSDDDDDDDDDESAVWNLRVARGRSASAAEIAANGDYQ